MYIRKPLRRLIVLGIPAIAIVVGVVALPPASRSSAADPKVGVTPISTDRRSVTMTATAMAMFEPDVFSAEITIDSGTQPADAVDAGVNGMLEKVQSLLKNASLPAAEPLTDAQTPYYEPTINAGKANVFRRFTVKVDSWESAQKVRQVLAPITDTREGSLATPRVQRVLAYGENAQLAADPTAGESAARRNALMKAQADATKCAEVFGMHIGQPISISEVRSAGVNTGGKGSGYSATCTVTFELVQ